MGIFQNNLYTFKNFTDLTEEESGEVLIGRNEQQVRRWMTSDSPITLDEHMRFLGELKKSSRMLYVRIDRAGSFVGVYSVNDMTNQSARGGFGVTSYARRQLLSLNVVFQGMNYMFREQGLSRIYGFQRKSNQSVIRLNALLGLSPVETVISGDEEMQQIEITRQHWEQRTRQDFKLLKLMDRTETLNGTT